jgi:hypothetical protein
LNTYTITSDNFAAPRGSTISDADMLGCNIPALIEAGHLSIYQPEAPAAEPEAAPVAETPEEPA